jgi:signal transduction histidine kinase/ligand-binding sensor domain-containing protein
MTRQTIVRNILSAIVLAAVFICTGRAERLPVRLFSSADGLGSSFVDFLMRDSHGFVWFCTRDGLSRFDGSRFVTYQIGETDPPSGIESLMETRNGDYWISTTSGLYRYRSSHSSVPKLAANNSRPVLPAELVSKKRGMMMQSRDGRLWFVADGLYAATEASDQVRLEKIPLTLPPEIASVNLGELQEGDDGSFWMNSTLGVVRLLPDQRVVVYRVTKGLGPISTGMLRERNGRIWLSRSLDVFVFQPETFESLAGSGKLTIHELSAFPVATARTETEIALPSKPGEAIHLTTGDFLKDYQAQKFYQSRDGHVWLTTDGELLEYDGRQFHRYTVAQGLAPGMLRMTEDLAGNIWIGGRTLIRLDRQSIHTYTEADGLHATDIQAITEAVDGTMYFANSDYYISRLAGTSFVTTRATVAKSAVFRWASRYAMVDHRGDLWIISREKLYRFAAGDLARPAATYTEAEGLTFNESYQIFEDHAGTVWVSQQPLTRPESSGLARLAPGETTFRRLTPADGYPMGKSASSFAEDREGNLWLGFYEGGLARVTNGRVTFFADKGTIPPGLITDILIDRSNRLWLSTTTGGLSRWDDPHSATPVFVNFNTNSGMSSNNVRTITEDNLGNIYAGTVRGVDRLSPDSAHIKHLSVSDGLAGDFVADSHCDRTGAIWFATTNGVSRLVPAVEDAREPPAVLLGGLRVAGVAQAISDLGQPSMVLPELSHTQNTIQVDFFALDFRPGAGLRYQYKLEGSGQDWSLFSDQRTVTLANLQAGRYRLLVRAINSDGQISTQPAVVMFRILPPFWLRWWFIALCILLVAAVVIAIYRYRIARLREVNAALQEANRAAENLRLAKEERLAELERVRQRIATDLHDDIGASLTQIAILSEVAQQQNSLGNGAVAEPLGMIYNVSNELVGTMSDIVWAINPRKDHLHDLTQRMRRFASDVLSAKDIDFEFIAPPHADNLALGANVRREVFLIFKEAVNNVVKHSQATVVAIGFDVAGDRLRLQIRDNGNGFVPPAPGTVSSADLFSDQRGGNGLISMRRRAADLGGEYSLESSPGHGTTVILELPVHLNADVETTPTHSDSDVESITA